MRDMPFRQKKEYAQQFLATAFAQDYLTQVEFEERVEKLESAETYDAVDELVADLPVRLAPTAVTPTGAQPPATSDSQVMSGRGQVVRKRGVWLRSPKVVISHQSSVVTMRFDQAGDPGFEHLELEFDVSGSTLRLLFPEGTRVIEELNASASVITIARRLQKRENPAGPVVRLTGSVQGSTVRITKL